MLDEDNVDKLNKILKLLEINFERLDYAYSRIELLLPFNASRITNLEAEQISFIDQYIFRFSKIQDIMGEKLFRMILESVEEKIESLAFIDILNKLEQLEVLPDKTKWLYLRKLRNEVSHEYPMVDEEAVVALNSLFNSKKKLAEFYKLCINYLKKHTII
ncbi:MAG: toxin-antitoxin system antitoxin subunit [Bacteroidales bacterium]|nr:toxin-antitoxin system antitoxin subunit [Bacteroidales bacterium]